MSPKLIISNLSKTYQEKGKTISALSNIDIAVKTGEIVCVIGPNGSGKSTLLKIIAGLLKESTGSFVINDGPGSYLPQGASLLPWATVEDNLFLPGAIKNVPKEKIKQQINKFIKDFKLEEFRNLYPSTLSGGMQQKVAILRTILNNSSLLILDEPFSALDAITRSDCQKWLIDIIDKAHSTVLCVTHDIDEAIFLADTIYVLSSRPGKIKEKFKVFLPRPRHHKDLISKEAVELKRKLISLLINTNE